MAKGQIPPPRQSLEDVAQLILQHGRPAAVVGARRIFLAPHISALPIEHPVRRHVIAKPTYALDIAAGLWAGPYSDHAADRWAILNLRRTRSAGRRRRWGTPVR